MELAQCVEAAAARMAPGCCCLRDMCEYDTNKVVRIRSVKYGSIKWAIHLVVLLYVGFVLLYEKRYQKQDSIISSVHTKVKGIAEADSRIWDTAEYTLPMQGVDSFFVITNILRTEKQVQGTCAEYPTSRTMCFTDEMCEKGHAAPQSNGIQTGKCVSYNSSVRTCEVSAWCPVESERPAPRPAVLNSAENFTVLIKNNIHFPTHDHTVTNIPTVFNVSCTFNRFTSPQCPIFRLGDIFQETGENFSDVAIQGGVMGMEINWNCNLDPLCYHCEPKYSFRRLDDKKETEALSPGYNFRFAKYFKLPDGREERTLIKAYGIRFDIQVFGTGGKFNFFELVVYIGSSLSYFGLAVLVIDFLITSFDCPCCIENVIKKYCKRSACCKEVKKYHRRKKLEYVIEPGSTAMYVSFVDREDIYLVDKPLSKSLQETNGHIVALQRNSSNMRDVQLPVLVSQNPEDLPLLNRSEKSDPKIAPWCVCEMCQNMEKRREQLCCRKSHGPCITSAPHFVRLVLSRPTLEFILLYKEPLLKLHSADINNKLRHCAYEQYIHWRFGSDEVETYAVIPSCCKQIILEMYPSTTASLDPEPPKPITCGLCC
ncbi:P2X purinoceptor 7-like [Lissotriton helveticus]